MEGDCDGIIGDGGCDTSGDDDRDTGGDDDCNTVLAMQCLNNAVFNNSQCFYQNFKM